MGWSRSAGWAALTLATAACGGAAGGGSADGGVMRADARVDVGTGGKPDATKGPDGGHATRRDAAMDAGSRDAGKPDARHRRDAARPRDAGDAGERETGAPDTGIHDGGGHDGGGHDTGAHDAGPDSPHGGGTDAGDASPRVDASGSHTLFSLVVAGGNNQFGVPSATLPNALVVRAVDFHRVPVVGEPVTFEISTGSGMLTAVQATTDAGGYASATLQLGGVAAVTTVTTTAGPATVSFTETAVATLATTGVAVTDATQDAGIQAQFGVNFMGNYLDVELDGGQPPRPGSIPGVTRLQEWPNAVVRIHANPAINGGATNASLPIPYATATWGAWDFALLDQQILDIQSISPGQEILLCVAYAPYDAADEANTGIQGGGTPLVTFPKPNADPGYGYLSTLATADGGTAAAYADYTAYIENLVRYYDGSGFTDAYGTHTRPAGMLPIKYWSLANEPNWSGAAAEWNNVGYPPDFAGPYPAQFAPEQFVAFWNATVPAMKSIAGGAGNTLLMVGPETAGSFYNWYQYVEAVLNLPVTKSATGAALYEPVPAKVSMLPDVISIHDYGAEADDGMNGGGTDVEAFQAIQANFIAQAAQVNTYLAAAGVSRPVWFGEIGMMQKNAASGLGDIAWGRSWTGMSAAWYGWAFDQIAATGVSAMAEFSFATRWNKSVAGTPDGDDQRTLLDSMDMDQTTPVIRYWTLAMLDQFFPSGSTFLAATLTSQASPPNGIIEAYGATPGGDSARIAVVNMPDPSGTSMIAGGSGTPQNVTVSYTYASATDAEAAATTMPPIAFFFDNTLFTGTELTSTDGVTQIKFAPIDIHNPPTDNGVPECPAASLLTPTIEGSTVTVTVSSPGYGLVLIDFPTAGTPAVTAPYVILEATSGDGQTGAVGAALAAPFVATVVDSRGAVLAGVPVTFSVATGTGTLSATSVTTDAAGQASTTLTPGGAGAIVVQASAVDLAPIEFAATGG